MAPAVRELPGGGGCKVGGERQCGRATRFQGLQPWLTTYAPSALNARLPDAEAGGERKESEMRRKLHGARSRLRNLSLTYVVNVRGLGEACFV